ncbi:hypothetical protein [Geomonas subterranea]|nr:hypothetical protein [Geomonas fuzhouensis]
MTILDQFAEGANMVSLDAFSSIVDTYFENDNWRHSPHLARVTQTN